MTTESRFKDPALRNYAITDRQREVFDCYFEVGSQTAAAKRLGITQKAVWNVLDALWKRGVRQGYSPFHDMTHPVPEPFVLKGTSTLYDREGQVKLQWVKTKLSDELLEAQVRDFVLWLADDVKGLSPLVEPPPKVGADLLALYGIGDPHFGLRSWKPETGADFDLKAAEIFTTGAIDRLVSVAPQAGTALLLNTGDYTHQDDNTNMTPASRNILDVDGRYAKVMQVGMRAMVHAIQRLLERHFRVIVWMMPGNHDPHTSFALAIALDAFFSNEPRVEIDLSPGLYKYMRFGKVLIGAHHGHGAKAADLPLIMATDRPEDWGETKFRYLYGGHIHHLTRKEWPGVVFETFRTLAPGDAWHAGKGYRSGRDMQLIVHSKDYGEIERHRCDISMIQR